MYYIRTMIAFLQEVLPLPGLPPWLRAYIWTMLFYGVVYVAFFVIERLRPVERVDWSSLWLNVRVALVLQAVIMILASTLQPALMQASAGWRPAGGLVHTADYARQGLLFVVYLLAYDFLYYWLHRWMHKFDGLWAIHKLHHTETHVNVTTTLRVHWLEEVLKMFVIIFPLSIVFDAPPVASAWLAATLGIWLFFVHANMKISFGPLSWLITSPAVHRIHHSTDPVLANRNFAVLFPVWDVLFGTYVPPKPGWYPQTGVAGETTRGFVDANMTPFNTLAAQAAAKRRQTG